MRWMLKKNFLILLSFSLFKLHFFFIIHMNIQCNTCMQKKVYCHFSSLYEFFICMKKCFKHGSCGIIQKWITFIEDISFEWLNIKLKLISFHLLRLHRLKENEKTKENKLWNVSELYRRGVDWNLSCCAADGWIIRVVGC